MKQARIKKKKKAKVIPVVVKKRKIEKKNHIFFKYGIGHLVFIKKHSNLFLILKTESRKHVVTITAGSCNVGRTKKQKISPHSIQLILKELKEYCMLYNVNRLRFYLKSDISKHYYNILKYLHLYDIKVLELSYILHKAHNGMRGRKLRRI
jgi:ribosomal protein S11